LPQRTTKKYFEKQFYLAGETKLPLFLHLRNAGPDFLDIISRCRSKFTKGVVHSFDGSAEICKSLIDLGLYIGLNGCSLKTVDNLKVIAQIPVDRILIETDAPWCQIRPSHAGFKHIKTIFPEVKKEKWVTDKVIKTRAEPCHIVQVLEVIAATKNIKAHDLANQIMRNTCEVFF